MAGLLQYQCCDPLAAPDPLSLAGAQVKIYADYTDPFGLRRFFYFQSVYSASFREIRVSLLEACCWGARGSVNEKVLPRPSGLQTPRNSPPWASMMRRLIASPMRRRVGLVVKKGPKPRAPTAGSSPTPV